MMAFVLIFVVGALFNQAYCHSNGDRHEKGNVGIIGGHHILIEKAPFMASLRLNGTYHWCGASIIHDQFVLTAAHCIVPNREFKVLVGTDNINGKGQLFEIEKIVIHQNYNNSTMDYDVCLIKLKTVLTYSSKVAKVNLPELGMKLAKGTELNATGWGATGLFISTEKTEEADWKTVLDSCKFDNYITHAVSPMLLQVEVPIVAKKRCKVLYAMHKHAVTSHMMCAGTRGHDACQGDSGGPLTLGNVQVGITSFGLGCGIMPGIYTRVASVIGWIDKKISELQ